MLLMGKPAMAGLGMRPHRAQKQSRDGSCRNPEESLERNRSYGLAPNNLPEILEPGLRPKPTPQQSLP